MKVVVTGGSGLAGRLVIEHLVEQGYDVHNADTTKPEKVLAPFKLVDMTDTGQVFGALNGADAVAHLAAIPRPTFHTNDVVFRTNMMAWFNVLEASAVLGIKRIVFASSMSVFGVPFFYRPYMPWYVPMDEDHPHLPQDPYALSKHLGEEMAEAYVRRTGDMTIISLRLSWIHTPETFMQQIVPLWEKPAAGAANLWSYVDSRDAAQAFRLGLEADLTGHHPFVIAARDSFMKEPTRDLMARFYPDAEIRPELTGRSSILSSARATQILGYQPGYLWESYL